MGQSIDHVVIIGGGFSGTLQAINQIRHGGPRATIVERRGQAARGLAYSAEHPGHLLNVRAANMSAFPDDPGHFERWLAARGLGGGSAFVPRMLYGAYLGDQLDAAIADAGGQLKVVQGSAEEVDVTDEGVEVRIASGPRIAADAVVLALGNLPPHRPAGLAADMADRGLYASDPWSADIADGLGDEDEVLLLGTGLTMVDTMLLLDARGFRGQVTALSRRGLLPRSHDDRRTLYPPLAERPRLAASALLAKTRTAAAEIGWHAAVDRLRPFTQSMWLAASDQERGRFLRHLRPWWDVHRHRLAPAVAGRLDELIAAGRLRLLAGKTLSFRREGDAAKIEWRPRGGEGVQAMHAQRIINCTGPASDLLASAEPLLLGLIRRGLARADRWGLGLDVDLQARLIDVHGKANHRLFALGPMTKGTYWEITAVPDIRQQAWTLSRYLSNAHWVGGEGL